MIGSRIKRILEQYRYQLSLRQAHRGTPPIRRGYIHSPEIRGERHLRLMTNSKVDKRKILTK